MSTARRHRPGSTAGAVVILVAVVGGVLLALCCLASASLAVLGVSP